MRPIFDVEGDVGSAPVLVCDTAFRGTNESLDVC